MDYFAHDAVYRTLRERGAEGWSSEEEVRALFDHILPWLPSPAGRGASLLELGCGAGSLSLLLAAQGHTVTGIDIAPTAIQWAWERPQSVGLSAQFQVGDVVTLSPFADAVFDTVVDGHCLHCIVGEDRARCLEAVHRVLRPGGTFIVATMCGAVLDEGLQRQFDPRTCTVVVDGRPTRHIGAAADIVAELARAGFDVVEAHVEPRTCASEQDDLFVLARKGRRQADA